MMSQLDRVNPGHSLLPKGIARSPQLPTLLVLAVASAACASLSMGIDDISFLESGLALPGAEEVISVTPRAGSRQDLLDHIPAGPDDQAVEASFQEDGLEDVVGFLEGDLGGEAELRFTMLRVIAGEGIDNFDAIRSVVVVLTAAPGGPPEPLTLVDCHADRGCPLGGTELLLPSATDQNLIDHLRGGGPTFTVRFTGRIPRGAWQVDVEGHLSAELSARYP